MITFHLAFEHNIRTEIVITFQRPSLCASLVNFVKLSQARACPDLLDYPLAQFSMTIDVAVGPGHDLSECELPGLAALSTISCAAFATPASHRIERQGSPQPWRRRQSREEWCRENRSLLAWLAQREEPRTTGQIAQGSPAATIEGGA